MRTLTLFATGALLASTVAAHATPPQPGPGLKGCGAVVFRDTTPDGTFGGPRVYNGVAFAGPIVIADTDDIFANAVDGRLVCTLLVDGNPEYAVDSGSQSYVVAVAKQAAYYDVDPTDVLQVCGTLDLTNAHGEQASFDLGCRAPNVIPGSGPACDVTQFLPQPVRPLVEAYLDC